jgi:hypothetical protein
MRPAAIVTAAVVGSVGVGALIALGGIAVALAVAVPLIASVSFRVLDSPRLAAYLFILYLPIDWLVDLELDSLGHPEGRLLRDLATVIFIGSWLVWRYQQKGRQLPTLPPLVALGLVAVLTISVVELANSWTHGPATGLVGIRTRLLPLLLLPVGFDLARTAGFLKSVNVAIYAVTVVSGVVVVLQLARQDTIVAAIDPRLSYALPGVGAAGESVGRYPGPFLGAGLPEFLIIAFVFGTASFVAVRDRNRIALWLLAAILWSIALLANNQRSLLLFLLLDAPLVVIFGMTRRRVGLLVLVVVALLPATMIAGAASSARLSTITSDPYQAIVQEHLVVPFVERDLAALRAAPLGLGLGSASPGARFVLGTSDVQVTPESYIAALILEVGIVGLIAYALLFAALAWGLAAAIRASDHPNNRLLAAGCLAVLVWVLQLSPTYEPLSYYPFAQLFWLTCGIALGLREHVRTDHRQPAKAARFEPMLTQIQAR